jgi:hypothetical protein
MSQHTFTYEDEANDVELVVLVSYTVTPAEWQWGHDGTKYRSPSELEVDNIAVLRWTHFSWNGDPRDEWRANEDPPARGLQIRDAYYDEILEAIHADGALAAELRRNA